MYRMDFEEEGGKKSKHKNPRHRHKKTQNKKDKIVMGKVYADWCGHCQALKPEWARMKKIVPMHRVVFVEINDRNKDAGIDNLNRIHGVNLPAPEGYPTIFRFGPDKQIAYYDGERKAAALAQWALHGGSSTGGKRRRNRTEKKSRGTRKRRGFFDWLKF